MNEIVEIDGDGEQAGEPPALRRYVAILVVLCLFAAVGEFMSRDRGAPLEHAGWLIGDCLAYRNITRSLLENHSFDYRAVDPAFIRWFRPFAPDPTGRRNEGDTDSLVSVTVDGRLVPKHPILFPIALLLPFALAREWGLLFFNVAQCTLLVVLVFVLAKRYTTPFAAFAAACGFLAVGIVRNYMYNVSPDVFATVLVLGGTLLMLRIEKRGSMFVGGVLIGLSLWMRPTNLVGVLALVPLVASIVKQRGGVARLIAPVSGLLVGVAGFLMLNAHWFGSPFVTSYDRILVIRNGVWGLVSHRGDMHRKAIEALVPTLFAGDRSFLQTAPYWPLFFLALPRIASRRQWEVATLFGLVVAPAAFLLKYDFWYMSHYGNRFLFLPAAVSAVGLAWLFDRGLIAARTRRAVSEDATEDPEGRK